MSHEISLQTPVLEQDMSLLYETQTIFLSENHINNGQEASYVLWKPEMRWLTQTYLIAVLSTRGLQPSRFRSTLHRILRNG